MATRGPDPEMVKARAAAEAAEEARRKAAEEADRLRAEKAEQEAKAKADQEARAKAAQDAKAKADLEAQAEAARRQFEEDTRRKVEAEIAEKKRSEEEAQRKAAEEAAARQKAIEDARKAIEFVAGNFDHFGKTLMMIGLKDRPTEIRLQGVDSVDDPALHKLAADALAAQPRNLRCRQTDRLTDGTPLYRCLITKETPRIRLPTFRIRIATTSRSFSFGPACCWPRATLRAPMRTPRTTLVAASSISGVE